MLAYHELLEDILDNGNTRYDRTGVGTLSVFGRQLRYDLQHGFPLLTTRRLHIRSIIHELLWFLQGRTDTLYLNANGVSIWDEWADEKGELGPIYGAQWRKWDVGDGKHVDQISELVDGLKNRPFSRRHLFHAWNPAYLPDETKSPQENVAEGKMALPPCHLLYQFYVASGRLSGQVYIRSNDMFLGHPFNVASLALLTHMLAQQCQLTPGEIVITIGDAHLYLNHLEQAKELLTRTPRYLPALHFNRTPDSIFDYVYSDFELTGYGPHPPIKAEIAI